MEFNQYVGIIEETPGHPSKAVRYSEKRNAKSNICESSHHGSSGKWRERSALQNLELRGVGSLT
jgi:hypothetical protein